MKRYYIEGNVIRIIRYVVDYSINKDTKLRTYATNGKIYVNDDVKLAEEKERLERQGAEYTVTELDVNDIEKFDGINVTSDEDARKLIEPTLEEVKAEKIKEISEACEKKIYDGIDVEISGEVKHFSLKIEDQLNLNRLAFIYRDAKEDCGIVYHADGELCSEFLKEDFFKIVNEASEFISKETEKCNRLMKEVEGLLEIGEVLAVKVS